MGEKMRENSSAGIRDGGSGSKHRVGQGVQRVPEFLDVWEKY